MDNTLNIATSSSFIYLRRTAAKRMRTRGTYWLACEAQKLTNPLTQIFSLSFLFFSIRRTVGGLLVSAGVGKRVVSRDEALAAVEIHMNELRTEADTATPEMKEKWDWKNVVQMNYCVETTALLNMLDVSAEVFGCRSFVPKEGATKYAGGWSLGYYHALAQSDLEALNSNVIPRGKEIHKHGEAGSADRTRRVSSVVPMALSKPRDSIVSVARRRSVMMSIPKLDPKLDSFKEE